MPIFTAETEYEFYEIREIDNQTGILMWDEDLDLKVTPIYHQVHIFFDEN